MSRSGRVEIDILRPTAYPLPDILDESDYRNLMETQVEPYLSKYRESGKFGKQSELYYEIYRHENSKATIVICHGYLESCIKYRELIYYFHRCGFQVCIYDQRGHGKSRRNGPSHDIVHIDSFAEYINDLHRFVNSVVLNQLGCARRDLYLFAHSFGATVAARYLEIYPNNFARAILNSPLFGLNSSRLPDLRTLFLSYAMIISRQGTRKCIGQNAFDFRPNPMMSSGRSEARYMYYHQMCSQHKEYQLSGCDYYWARELLTAGIMAKLKLNVDSIRSDVLVVMAGQDDLADRKAQEGFVSKLKYGKAVLIPESRHDTFSDRNAVLKDYMALIMSWFDPKNGDNQ